MKLVKANTADVSQKSNPSQFPDGTQQVQMNEKIYRGIKVHVSFKGEGEI